MQYSKRVLELSGLTQVANDDEGQEQYIGTKEQWEKAEKLNEWDGVEAKEERPSHLEEDPRVEEALKEFNK